ncbi:MAG TPA: hypothetical protein VJP40_07715 [bacterium]|nr:hypothetical protein [bacterium]
MHRHFFFLATALILFSAGSLQAREILGSNESEAKAWAAAKGYQVHAAASGTEGCLKGHRYLPMSGPSLQIKAVYFNPLYKTDSQVIAMVDFEPATPLTKAQAEILTIQAAPIAGTRPPTHKQPIAADGTPCAPANGGYDGRYTEDYIVEYFYAPDKVRIEKVRVYNDGIR